MNHSWVWSSHCIFRILIVVIWVWDVSHSLPCFDDRSPAGGTLWGSLGSFQTSVLASGGGLLAWSSSVYLLLIISWALCFLIIKVWDVLSGFCHPVLCDAFLPAMKLWAISIGYSATAMGKSLVSSFCITETLCFWLTFSISQPNLPIHLLFYFLLL